MKRFRSIAFLALAVGLTGCKDQKLRAWATTVDDYLEADNAWKATTVYPGLLLLCDLERNVFDHYHKGPFGPPPLNPAPNPNPRRYCKPTNPSDPVPPPPPPKDWDE